LQIPRPPLQFSSKNNSHKQLSRKRQLHLNLHSIPFKGYKDTNNYNRSRKWLRLKSLSNQSKGITTMGLLIKGSKWRSLPISHRTLKSIILNIMAKRHCSILLLKWILIWPSFQIIQINSHFKDQTFRAQLSVFLIKAWCLKAMIVSITYNCIL